MTIYAVVSVFTELFMQFKPLTHLLLTAFVLWYIKIGYKGEQMRIEYKPENSPDKTEEHLSPPTTMTLNGEKVVNPTKGMTLKQIIEYYATYYVPKILFVLLLVGFVASFLVFALRKNEPAVNILFVNHHRADTVDIEETLKPYLVEQGISEKKEIEINASVNMDLSNFATYEAKNAFDTLIASRSFTLMFADEETFKACADATYFRDLLNEFISTEQLLSYGTDNIIFGYDDQTSDYYMAGIRLNRDNCPWLKNTDYEEVCVGVLYSDVPDEQVKPLLQYILNYK